MLIQVTFQRFDVPRRVQSKLSAIYFCASKRDLPESAEPKKVQELRLVVNQRDVSLIVQVPSKDKLFYCFLSHHPLGPLSVPPPRPETRDRRRLLSLTIDGGMTEAESECCLETGGYVENALRLVC